MNARIRKLRAWMTLNGYTPTAVSMAVNLSKNAVYRYIRGKMPSSTLRAWYLAHGCPSRNLPPAAKKSTTDMGKAA